MDVEDFRPMLIMQINSDYENPEERSEAYLSQVIKALEDSGQCINYSPVMLNAVGYRGKKLELAGYCFDEFDKTLNLYICKYSGGELSEVLIKTEIERQFAKLNYFIKSVFDASIFKYIKTDTNEYNVAKFILENRGEIERYVFVLITDDILSERKINDLNLEFIDGKSTQPVIWDIKRFCELSTTDNDIEESEINFEDYGFSGISCIKANEVSDGADYNAYLCVMPAKLLSDIFEVYGGKLLETNVRSFLSAKGKVNRGIKNTIQKEPKRFFAYNNGISTTATDVTVKKFSDGLKITKIKSLQIVNGGQTTVSIYSAEHGKPKFNLDGIYVPMKICVISSENSDEITQRISEYSNSQNKVSKADFFSNDPFQMKIEKISRHLDAPPKPGSIYSTKWYYERARGSYAQEQLGMTAAQLKDYLITNPKNQVLTKTDFARYRNTFDMKPDLVSKGPQMNMGVYAEEIDKIWHSTEEHGVAGSKINDTYFKDTVAMAIIFNDLDKMIADKKLTPWYISGFKQNLVIYTISRFMLEIHNLGAGYSLDFNRIWKNQTTPECLKSQLHELAKDVHDVLTDPDRPKILVPEYAKDKRCWDAVRKITVSISPDVGEYILSKKKVKEAAKTAETAESNHLRMKANFWVVEKGQEFWDRVRAWGIENSTLSTDEKSVLNVAATMETKRKPPTEAQSNWIVKIYNRLVDDGFDGEKY